MGELVNNSTTKHSYCQIRRMATHLIKNVCMGESSALGCASCSRSVNDRCQVIALGWCQRQLVLCNMLSSSLADLDAKLLVKLR